MHDELTIYMHVHYNMLTMYVDTYPNTRLSNMLLLFSEYED